MPPRKRAVPKRTKTRKPARKVVRVRARKAAKAAPPPPTIAGVFTMISLKPGFLDLLLTDMNSALESVRLDLPPAEREALYNMLTATYHVTGAELLKIVRDWPARRVLPPPPPWAPNMIVNRIPENP